MYVYIYIFIYLFIFLYLCVWMGLFSSRGVGQFALRASEENWKGLVKSGV